MINEIEIDLRGIEEWRSLRKVLPEIFSPEIGERFSRHVSETGLIDPLSGPVSASEVSITSTNYRETVTAAGTNSRQRAVLMCLNDELSQRGIGCDVYASEAVSPLAKRLAAHLPNFVGSEYLPDTSDRVRHPTLMHQNILDFSFEDASFDIYLSCDVLEHVPGLDRALGEAARILRPGGVFMGTVPFAPGREQTLVRAVLTEAGVEHIEESQYHGNPTRPQEGSLVFQVPAWDLLDMCRDAGFEDPRIRLIVSKRHGVFAGQVGFISLFYCVRAP